MRRKKHRFRGHVFTLEKSIRKTIYTAAITITISLFWATGLPLSGLSSKFLIQSLTQTVLAFHSPEETSFKFSAYDILERSVLSIKASEIMNKKYAAKYGGIIKKETGAKENSKEATEPPTNNTRESDVSTKAISFINTPGVPVDAQVLLDTELGFYPQDGAPRVLIVHTHTSEAYACSEGSRSEDPNRNVVSVGKAIYEALSAAGIGVIHDTTQNDNPSYNQSYKKALTVIEKNLSAYPTLEVVLDIHRDYIKRDDGTLVKPTCITKDGKKAAQIMFVMGTDSMGLYHPNWRHNLAFAAQIQNKLQHSQPGLCRSINIRTERFNQHATKGSMIIEVGTGVNTLEEAQLSGKLVGEAIAAVLNEQS